MAFHLVSIGVSKHQNAQYTLQYAADDAKDFFELLTQNISGLGYSKLLTDSEATYGQIRSALGRALSQKVEPEDTFVFFFSGHGTIGETADGKHTSLYLVPFDVANDVSASCISVLELKSIFDQLGCKNVLVFIDSCFSGYYRDSKFYPNTSLPKGAIVDKTFENTIKGAGRVVFTASNGEEKSYEDSDYEKGVFTYHLLEELQHEREESFYPIDSLYEPVKTAVLNRVRLVHKKDQTPQFLKEVSEEILIPTFRKKLKYSPELLSVPSSTNKVQETPPQVEIELTAQQENKHLNKLIKLVQKSSSGNEAELIEFEQYCSELILGIKDKWEKIFIDSAGNIELIPKSIAQLEAASYEYALLGGVVASMGTKPQATIYAEYLSELLRLREGRAGLVALISVPEVIVGEIVYLTGIVALARNDLSKWAQIISYPVALDYGKPPKPLPHYYGIFYSEALGGNSITVHEHFRRYLGGNISWLKYVAPRITTTEALENFEHQINFLLNIFNGIRDVRMYSDFGYFGSERVMPLVNKILYNSSMQNQLAALFNVKLEVLIPTIKAKTEKIVLDGSKSRFWDSISSRVFDTTDKE